MSADGAQALQAPLAAVTQTFLNSEIKKLPQSPTTHPRETLALASLATPTSISTAPKLLPGLAPPSEAL